MTRIKAASSHLTLSVFIFSIVVFVLIYIWYPSPHFAASGGWQGLKIAAGVDLVLGPLLTFIVFNSTKAKNKLLADLAVIISLQFMALAWGVNTIYSQRPFAIVYWESAFYTVPASALIKQNIKRDDLNKFSEQTPALIYAQKPDTESGLIKIAEITAQKQIPPHHQIELYRPLNQHFNALVSQQVDIAKIIANDANIKAKLNAILAANKRQMADYYYFSLRSKYRYIILLFSQQGQWLDYISVPFKSQAKNSPQASP